MKPATPNHSLRLLRRFGAGWLCLLAGLAAMRGIIPILLGIVAWIDGEHTVNFSAGAEGVELILGHDRADARHAPGHDHCLVTRMMVAFAKASQNGEADHVLYFGSSGNRIERDPEATLQGTIEAATPTPLHADVKLTIVNRHEPREIRKHWMEVAPPRPSSLLAGLRTTLLLI